MVSIRIDSKIDLNPRAPVFLAIANLAIDFNASSLKSKLTFSILNKVWYCFIRAFFGLVKILIRDASSKSSSEAITGNLPTNSGIRPYLTRSSDCKFFRISPIFESSSDLTSAPKPIAVPFCLCFITWSRPENAPPQIKRMFVVST